MTYQFSSIKKEDGVGIVTIHRPPANALSPDLVEELDRVIDEVSKDNEIRVTMFASSINMFMAGADLKSVRELILGDDPIAFGKYVGQLNNMLNRLERLPKLSIAVINGHALGGGCEFCLACDFRYMTNDPKVMIGLPEANLGLLPGGGGTQRLGRLLGRSRTMDIIINTRNLSSQEALDVGLVQKVFDKEVLYERSLEEAKRLAAGATIAYAEIKRCLVEGLDKDLAGGLLVEREGILRLLQTEDAMEGVTAFVEKRKPRFSGK